MESFVKDSCMLTIIAAHSYNIIIIAYLNIGTSGGTTLDAKFQVDSYCICMSREK